MYVRLLNPLKKHSFLQNILFKFLTVLTVTLVIILYVCRYLLFNEEPEMPEYMCHYSNEGDALPSLQDVGVARGKKSIFFHETSCRGGLTVRQACVIESAANAHPERPVYVLFSSPVKKSVLKSMRFAMLHSYPNIQFARVYIDEYAKNTPLENMVFKKTFYQSTWWQEHTSDVLRSLTLYKWGGIYLDTDVLVTKSLTPLGDNWVGMESSTLANSAAIAMSMDYLGRKMAYIMMNELSTTYKPELWVYNGPGAITRVLHKICNTHNVADWSAKTCGGLQIYGPEYFYPVHYTNWRILFESGDLDASESNAYTYHLWNKITYNTTIEFGSPYMKMAEEYCPMIFDMYADKFGASEANDFITDFGN